MTRPSTRWPRDDWLDAMWDSETVKPNERTVGYVFARYAGASDLTWCPWPELMRRTGIKSRDAINRAIKGLLVAGWLVETEPARQHYSARYQLTQPSVSQTPEPEPPTDSPVDNSAQQSGKQTAEPDLKINNGSPSSPFPDTSSPFPDTSSPFNGPDMSTTRKNHTTPRLGRAAPSPRRPDQAQAPDRTEHDPSPAKAGHDQTPLASNQQDARAETRHTRRETELRVVAAMACEQCDDNGRLPDGTTCGHDPPTWHRTANFLARQRKALA